METTQLKKKPTLKENVTAIFVLIILLGGCNLFLCSDEEPPAAKKVEEEAGMAYIMSQDFLKERLKSPATADFPWQPERNIYNGDSTFSISSYVDSQNGFGALIRTKYSAILKYNGNDSWSLIDIDLDE